MIELLRARNEWKFFATLPKADGVLAVAWWVGLALRGVLPAVFAIAMGILVAAVERGEGLAGPLTLTGVVFVSLQVVTPIHQANSANLGERTAAWLYDPQAGAIEVDGIDLRDLDLPSWRARLAAVFQDFTRFHWSWRDRIPAAAMT